MKKAVKIIVWIVAAVLAVVVVATLVAAPIAKSYINKHGEELVGRKVHIDELRLNVYTGHVAVRRLDLYEDNGTDVFVHFDTLDVKASLLKLLGSTVQLNHITLSGLHANIVQDGEAFNFNSLIDHFASSDSVETPKDTTPSEWVIKLYNIRLSHASVAYADLGSGKSWNLPDINLRVPGFVLGGEEASQGGLHIGFDQGGDLMIDANYDAAKNDFQLTAKLEDFALGNIEQLASDFLRFDHLGGSVEANLRMAGNVSEITKSLISGTVGLQRIDLQSEGKQLLGLRSLALSIGNINLDANRFDISSLSIDGLSATYEQWADHSNIDRLLLPSADSTASASASASAAEQADSNSAADSHPLSLTVGQFRISNTDLTYIDHTLPDPFSFPITGLTFEADNLSTSGANNARLNASLPGGGHLVLRWQGNIDNWKQHQDLFLTVKGLDMRQLSPWAVAYTGQPIEEGIFSLTSRNTIHNSNLDGTNKLDIYKARVGSRRKDVDPEMKLPLKTALYVLKDKDDKILIDMPVKGNIDNPEFNYMKVVWKTLGNLIVKVATSPARAVGNALGMGSDANLDFIAIDTTQRGLGSEQYHTLGQLAEIAKYDTLITLHLTQQMPQTDSADHRRTMLNSMVRQYLIEQGVAERQIVITTCDSTTSRTGYAVESKMNIDEQE